MNSYCNPEISYDAAENAELEATYYGAFKKYGMPYLDHCYATGLPMAQFDSHPNTPPLPLTEPLAAFVDIEEVGVRGGSHGLSSTHSTGKRSGGNSGTAKNSGHNNSSSTNTVISNNGGGDTEVDPYEGSVTRCICDFQHDDGYMICCDRCGVWQHVECMGVDGKHIPDSYLCELCYPRLVDKRRAVRIQSKKKEELEMEESSGSADDSLEEESTRRPKRRGGRRRDQGRRKTAERSDSGGGQRKSQQRRKRTSSEMEGKKHSDGMYSSSNKEQKRLRPQSFTGYERSDAWEGNSPTEREADARQFGTGGGPSPVQPNTYSSEVLNLLVMKVKTMGASNSSNVLAITQQLSRKCFKVVSYEDNSKGLEAIEMIKPNHTVAEYTGKTVMRREYERNQSDLSYPFTVCYMGINGVELCVDSNDFNNEAKFVRRSCTPNAKVVHLLEKTGLRFFICATKTIPSGKEITIPFYFDYQRSTVELKCPCGKFNCMVAKHFKRMAGARSSIATVSPTTTTAAVATAVLPAAATAQQRPVRQSKKRALDEFTDGADEEGDKDDEDPDPVADRCSTGALGSQSPSKRRNLGDVQPSEQQECRTATPGRAVKTARGRVASQTGSAPNNGSEKGSFLASMLQAHLARNSNLSKASLAPMGANVSDDIALLNKLSSVGALHLAGARIDQLEVSDASRGKSKDGGDDEQQPSLADRAVESDQPSKRKQQLPPTKETKAESETKEAADQSSDSADAVDIKTVAEEHQQEEGGGDKPAPKERRKNSKLLAEIQTFFRTEGSEDTKDSGDKKVSTREQRKIEAAERRFEKIEKSSARLSSRAMSSTSSTNQKQIKTRAGQQDGRTKKDEEASQRSSPKGMANKAVKPISVRNTSGKPQKPDDNKTPTRQQPDKKQTAADVKKSIKVTAAPSRMTRSSRK